MTANEVEGLALPGDGAGAARAAFEAGEHARCLRLLEAELSSGEALRMQFESLQALGRLDELRALYESEGSPRPLALPYARALAALGRAALALAALEHAEPTAEALLLDGELRIEAGHAALGPTLEERARQRGDEAPGLWLLAGRAFVRSVEAGEGDRRELSSRALACLRRHWELAGPTVDGAVLIARALRGENERGIDELQRVASEGDAAASWHLTYLQALLDDGRLSQARFAAERARQIFPDDPALKALASKIHHELWSQQRARHQPATEAADEPAPTGAPEFLLELRGRIRQGSIQPTRELPQVEREALEVLCRYERANIVLTGPPGCGKSAALRAIAARLASRQGLPRMLAPFNLFELDPIAIVGGTDNVGVLEGRLTALTRFCESNKIILFVDNLHLILGAGSYTGRPAGLSELLQPLLSSGNVKLVAACSDESYDALARSVGLERRMTRVRMPAMSHAEAAELLGWLRPRLEEHFALAIPEPMLGAAARLASEQVRQRALPDSAIDLLERAGAKALLDGASEVSHEHLLAALARVLQVPIDQVRLDQMTRLLHLEEHLTQRVIGQPEAVRVVADVIRVSKADLGLNSARPDGVFLFVGPSGVGKTELARALASALNPDDSGFLRLDMSEFAEPHNVSRLFGTTPGYVGFEQEGQLSSALRLNPGSVVLLDEIEKAHPKVYDVFLQVFDAGRLTDGRGKGVDCSRATFILTSNLGTAELIEGKVGFLRGRERSAERSRVVRSVLERHFRPEFLNRFDAIVVFEALSSETLRAIVAQKFELLCRRFADREIQLDIDGSVHELVAASTDHARSGARGVIQAIERLVVVPLARSVLARQEQRRFRVTAAGSSVTIAP